MIAPKITVRIQTAPFDAAAEAEAIVAGRADVGAVVTFTGFVRLDDGLIALTLECYAEMAEAEIARLVEDAQARWPLQGVTVIHRFGRLTPGEAIVVVITAAAHRRAAFAAAEFLMDHLKARAPFWKQEERATGSRWVEARTADDAALARWEAGHGSG
ncbi:molybdenum cofactor biosynthesis protein MoaE [Blastochloris viridis]|uniref:Molybdopterin synthase catalytic subunit n=1 Tax=Blastochloris viridis TaxID=1079 RepID=A0A0H5BCC8_BLAVI|nr:molybdenum cofactor biosynthesis protein MoaE [Blastochloris viridis]ALK10222.1 Molybdopterin synthase catalytic subunit [Blastochloris viridis]BAR99845.1 molybdenum cofactor biosynthesis protein MoaE [Blastochloris viridis]CUU42886.1 Molybdopterin synthase catalytic subunit [Blastochloris viridis]